MEQQTCLLSSAVLATRDSLNGTKLPACMVHKQTQLHYLHEATFNKRRFLSHIIIVLYTVLLRMCYINLVKLAPGQKQDEWVPFFSLRQTLYYTLHITNTNPTSSLVDVSPLLNSVLYQSCALTLPPHEDEWSAKPIACTLTTSVTQQHFETSWQLAIFETFYDMSTQKD